jgi:hypothetical protein
LKKFCSRTGKSEKDLESIIETKKEKIARSYSETSFELNGEFVAILLDAIFIIEFFLRHFEREKYEKLDYILSNAWIESHIKQDLIFLKNQLPFRFTQKFYKDAFDGEEATTKSRKKETGNNPSPLVYSASDKTFHEKTLVWIISKYLRKRRKKSESPYANFSLKDYRQNGKRHLKGYTYTNRCPL